MPLVGSNWFALKKMGRRGVGEKNKKKNNKDVERMHMGRGGFCLNDKTVGQRGENV